ncbi:MAG: DUF1214 domain-containing protein [Myxococcota bacterium]
MSDDQRERSVQRVLDGSTWNDFLDRLRDAGNVVLEGPADPLDRAEGFRYLTRLARAALQTFVEHADPLAPVLQRVVHETAKMGADNPDNMYFNAAIGGEHVYRLWGNRGTVHYLGFGTQIGHYGKGAGMPPSGYLEAKDMRVEPDGRFEIVVSCERPDDAPNWLPMKPETGTLIVRQTFLDRDNERPAELNIERVGGPPRPSPVTPQSIDEGITQAGNLVAGAAVLFANWADGFKQHVNELPQFDPAISNAVGGDPNIVYYHSYWELEPDQALVIEAEPPECEYWNFQLNNHWMESLDYRHYRIHVNKHTAHYEPDGSVRVIVAHRDPGHPNWIDTVGHRRGTMCWRWVRAAEHPQPRTRVVSL